MGLPLHPGLACSLRQSSPHGAAVRFNSGRCTAKPRLAAPVTNLEGVRFSRMADVDRRPPSVIRNRTITQLDKLTEPSWSHFRAWRPPGSPDWGSRRPGRSFVSLLISERRSQALTLLVQSHQPGGSGHRRWIEVRRALSFCLAPAVAGNEWSTAGRAFSSPFLSCALDVGAGRQRLIGQVGDGVPGLGIAAFPSVLLKDPPCAHPLPFVPGNLDRHQRISQKPSR